MKIIAVLFLLCSVSATWQQHVYWSVYSGRLPFYSVFDQNYGPIHPGSGAAGLQPYSGNEIAQRTFETTEETTEEKDLQERLKVNSEPRFFGYNKYLASVLLSSLNLLNTVTSFTTTTSTITVATMYNCFKSDLFVNSNPTPCRRKRDALSMLLIGAADENDSTTSFSSDGKAAASVSEELPKEGQNIDATHLVKSSLNEEEVHVREYFPKQISIDRYFRQNRNFGIFAITVVSTVTSYSVYYSTTTRIFSHYFANDGVTLLCLLPGMNLC
ncbi:uncharacterized protein LOC124198834 [Daphnia pulex]|uniref:uncharacterized protein LOC124198834 n=1 Tax=Daphnia pulex TaxID=6669 RepID=UPI001EDF7695|nr:uncharacterized protein LOC124198834 [Daphnia pulex]